MDTNISIFFFVYFYKQWTEKSKYHFSETGFYSWRKDIYKYIFSRCPDCGRVPPGRNIKQQLAVKKTVSKWKRNVKPVPTSAETLQQNGDNCQSKNKKDSVVISKKSLHPPPGPAPRNLNVRNNGAAASMQQNYFKRDFVWELELWQVRNEGIAEC